MKSMAARLGSLLLPALLALAGVPGSAGAGTSLIDLGAVRGDTLYVSRDQVVRATLADNEMLAASGAMTDAARAEALGAWRGFLPRLTLGAYRIRSDDPLYSFGFKLNQRIVTGADFNPALLNDPGVAENNITQARALMPLFNGGMALYGKRAADAAARAAVADHERAGETVEYQAIQAYEGLVLARAWVEVLKTALASAEGHVRQAQAMFDAEMVTEADLLQARVHRDALAQRLIEMRNMQAVAGENIKLLTALRTDLVVAPAEVGQAVDLLPLVPTGSPADRADIRAHRERSAAAGGMAKMARGRLLPHLNLSAEKNWFSRDEFLGDDADSWTVGIYATWDVFSGLENIGGLRKANAERRAAEHMLDFAERRAAVELIQARLTLEADAEDAAREGLRIVTNQYREGLASMVDLLDVQAAATMAEGNLVRARHDYRVSLAGLRYAGAAGAAEE